MLDREVLNGLTHKELVTNDVEKTVNFYREVFGWTFSHDEKMDYTLFKAPGGLNGGVRKPMTEQGEQPGTFDYLLVDSVDDYIQRISAAGGQPLGPKQEVPGYGYFVVFQDPGGVVQAAWENIPHGTEKEFK